MQSGEISPTAWPISVVPLAIGWAVLWLGLGLWTALEVRSLRQLSSTVVRSGDAVRETGNALERLRTLPFVGGEVGRVGTRVSDAGASAERSGRSSRTAVNHLAIVFGLAVALMPTVPMLALVFIVRRLAWRQKHP